MKEYEELLKYWKENESMEHWTGQDGHDARVTLDVIDKVLEILDIKVEGINN